MEFNKQELEHYSRHFVLPNIGIAGQKKLKKASVFIVGLGGLGSPVSMYLASAGVGNLLIADDDIVSLSNLQRQPMYGVDDIGKLKINIAKKRLTKINPNINLRFAKIRVNSQNIVSLANDFDIIIDGSDNFSTRYLCNDYCVLNNKTNIYGSVLKFDGQVSVFSKKKNTACFRCLFPKIPPPDAVPNCAEGGVLGALPGIIGSMQAMEAIKIICEVGKPLYNRFFHFNSLNFRAKEFSIKSDKSCPICGENPKIKKLIEENFQCNTISGNLNFEDTMKTINVTQLKNKIDNEENFHLIDVREEDEYAICKIEKAKLIPLSNVSKILDFYEKDSEIIVHCKLGGRSARAVEFLNKNGFNNVYNLEGGIIEWAKKIDKNLVQY